jgi:CTP:molybdopterin cytidylyltransferase MocA
MKDKKIDNKSVGVVILSAGLSSRMKTPKPFLRFDAKSLFIDKIINVYLKFGCTRVIVTINEEHRGWKDILHKYAGNDSIVFVPNMNPDYERFYSLKLGMEHIEDLEYCFIQNIDNPFIECYVLEQLYKNRIINGYAVPNFIGKGGHPVLIGEELINQISSTTHYQQNLKEFLRNYNRNNVEVDTDKILININSPEEYLGYFGNNYENQNERYIS